MIVALWMGSVLGYLYVDQVSRRYFEKRVAAVPIILRGETKADYVYASYSIALVHTLLVDHSVLPERWSFALIDFAGILLLFLSAAWCLRRLFPHRLVPLAGLLWLAVTTPLLFRHHNYHPSDFYAVAVMFFALVAAREHRYVRLALLCLLSGLLWEKALFVPLVYFAWESRRAGVRRAALTALPAAATTLLCFVFWRVAFPQAYRQPGVAEWSTFFRSLPAASIEWLVWIGPLCVVLADVILRRRRIDPFWLFWLAYVPLLAAVMFWFRGLFRELRSFWIYQPIFAGFVADWARSVAVGRGAGDAVGATALDAREAPTRSRGEPAASAGS